MKICILGAGPTGLGAAYHLQKLGHKNWQIFERNSYVGGLSTSFVDDAQFTWDVGGHVLFSHYDYFDKAVAEALGEDYYEHQRESWVRILQTWVPYPFQNNIRYLPDDALGECVDGLKNLQVAALADAANFKDWMDAVFGAGIVRHFMEPYNRKVWGVPLESMDKHWIAERVSVVELARIEKNIAEKRDDLSWGPNSTFKFPKHGGTGAIYKGIASRFMDCIHLNHQMQRVDIAKKEVTFCNGVVENYDLLINTTPLDLLISSCVAVPEIVKTASKELKHNGGLIAGFGFEAPRQDPKCWIYFPEDSSPFYRVTNFHNYSRYNVPNGDIGRYFSLMCETTYSEHKAVDRNKIMEMSLQGLIAAGMIDEHESKQIISSYLIDIPYSYPIPTLNRDAALKVIQPYLEERSIFSRGRFGAWRYEVGNMDHSFMQGVEVIEYILKNSVTKEI